MLLIRYAVIASRNNLFSIIVALSPLLMTTLPVAGQVVLQQTVTGGTSANSSPVTMPSVSGGSAQTYVLVIGTHSNRDVTLVTGGGLTWTEQVEQCGADNKSGIRLWTAQGSPTSSFQVQINWDSAANKPLTAILSRYTGVMQILDATGENTEGESGICSGLTKSTTPSLTLTSSIDQSVHVLGLITRNKTVSSASAGYSLNDTDAYGSGNKVTNVYLYEKEFNPATMDTFQATLNGETWWAAAGVVLKPGFGMSHRWALNEASGNTATDSLASSDGTLWSFPNDDSQWSCQHGGSLQFDGVDDYVYLTNESDYDFTSAMTVALWVNVSSFSVAEQAIVTKGDTAWRLERNGTTGALQFAVNGLNTNTVVPGSISINDNNWHHVAGVYDGAKLYLYVDGVEDNSLAANGSMATNGFQVYFGDNASLSGRNFHGLMSNLYIHDSALSATEIATLAKGPLRGWWKLDETSGTTAYDSSSSANHGTLLKMTGSEWIAGMVDGGLAMDGVNDLIDTGLDSNQATLITMMMWFRSIEIGSIGDNEVAQRLISQHRDNSKSRLGLGINNDRLATYWHDGAGNTQEGSLLSAGVWYHGAVTYDGTTVRLYLDGVETGNWPEAAMSAPSADSFTVGRGTQGASRHFNGSLDDIRLYNTALCAAEIDAIYQQTRGIKLVRWQEVDPR